MTEIPSLISWIMSHVDLYQYNKTISYKKEDIVTIKNTAYQSVSDNNLGNYPHNSNKWIKLV
jgi:hypothetical protein